MKTTKKEIIIVSIIFLISLILFISLLIAVGRNGGELKIDNNLLEFIYDHRGKKHNFNYYFNHFSTQLGYTYVTTIIMILTLVYTKCDKGWFCLLIGILLCIILHLAIKDIYDRERPNELMRWANETSLSFPSGHSTNSTFLYGFITYYLFKKNYSNKIKYSALGISIVIVLLVVTSRLILGVHYLTDVLAGVSLGLIIMCLMIVLYNVFEIYDLFNGTLLKFRKKDN
ncbi:MAG: phosphatase PAP2 family protein [Acholeplasmatales bacterium]|nr:phosphatase PAP2 family protein [Acholeplasmatales bacterium]